MISEIIKEQLRAQIDEDLPEITVGGENYSDFVETVVAKVFGDDYGDTDLDLIWECDDYVREELEFYGDEYAAKVIEDGKLRIEDDWMEVVW